MLEYWNIGFERMLSFQRIISLMFLNVWNIGFKRMLPFFNFIINTNSPIIHYSNWKRIELTSKAFKKATVIWLFSIMVVQFNTVYGSERMYYSIHLASFKNLENANRKVNSLKEKGKLVFWKEKVIPNEGRFYRVYIGMYEKREDAVAFWKKLKKVGAVSYFGVHLFRETIKSEKIKILAKPILKIKEVIVPEAHRIKTHSRFTDNKDGTVTDNKTKLMWIKNGWRLDFLSAATWADAIDRCKNFKLGGYTNWRLPSIDEWKTLIDTSHQNPALVEPNPFENIIAHMPYWSKTEYIYGRDHTCSKKCPIETLTVMLYSGNINHQNKTQRAFILPVRNLEPTN